MAGGRPRIEIDYKQVEQLAAMQCTDEEIAAVLGVERNTIRRRKKDDEQFCSAYKKGQERGKASLRRMQFKAAEAGNATMLIWLGKQYLGQSDKSQQELSGPGGGPIAITDTRSELASRLAGLAARAGAATDTSKPQ
jgi:hypothetical protein